MPSSKKRSAAIAALAAIAAIQKSSKKQKIIIRLRFKVHKNSTNNELDLHLFYGDHFPLLLEFAQDPPVFELDQDLLPPQVPKLDEPAIASTKKNNFAAPVDWGFCSLPELSLNYY